MSTQPRILVVDDEPSLLGYIRTLLEVSSYSVETASSGVEAVNRVQRGLKPDLVLLDMLMPGMDGVGTLEQLRAINPAMKVVMLSCVSDSRKVAETIRLGATDYLTKPFQKNDLEAVLRQCLRSGVPADEPACGPGDIVELSEDVFFVAASPAMRKIRKQQRGQSRGNLNCATRARSCSMKSAKCRQHSRQNCCTYSRTSSSRDWADAPP
jgi:CheY-like chemotaxis protein